MIRIIASIEARMGSSRLPGKVLSDVCGQPALSRLLKRLKRCEKLDDIILATTTSPKDDLLVKWAESVQLKYIRGSEKDVLSRVVQAHQRMKTDIIVEICGDMILLDPELIDRGIQTFLNKKCDVVTTTNKPSYPIGIDVVIFRYDDIEWIEKNIFDLEVREHVSLYFFNNPEKYKIINLTAPDAYKFPNYRLVLDYYEDLDLIRQIYKRLEPDFGDNFSIHEIIELLKREPELLKINSHLK